MPKGSLQVILLKCGLIIGFCLLSMRLTLRSECMLGVKGDHVTVNFLYSFAPIAPRVSADCCWQTSDKMIR